MYTLLKEREGEKMKNSRALFGLVVGLLLAAAPVYADVQAKLETGKPLSILEFSSLPQNHGTAFGRQMEWKYNEYRKGRIPVSTLDISRMR
jgi:hypothetical protein